MALNIYDPPGSTITVTANSTAVSAVGTLFTEFVQAADTLQVLGLAANIDSVTDDTHLVLTHPWPGSTSSNNANYVVRLDSPSRSHPYLSQLQTAQMLAVLQNSGIVYLVPGSVPDPGLGEDGNAALKITSGQWWLKISGVWVSQGNLPSGLNNQGIWNSSTTYHVNDLVDRLGTVYLCEATNTNAPPESNPSDWAVLGAKGDKGDAGAAGNTVRYGTGAPANGLGNDGDFYIATDTHFLYGPRTGGVWPAGTNLIGPSGGQGGPGATGQPGANGNTVRFGSGAPLNSLGADGDFYIDTVAHFIYGPRTSGTWPAGTSIVGPQGLQGTQGQGIQPGATGTLAQRAAFDGQAQNFVYLETDVAPFQLFVKRSNTTADWAGPTFIGGAAAVGDLGSVTDSVLQTFDYGVAA